MAAFPTTYQIESKSYSVRPDDNSVRSRSDSGKLRIRRLYGSTKYVISFTLYGVPDTGFATLLSFYETNKTSEITWTDPFTSVVYDVLMTEPPYIGNVEGPWAEVKVSMEGTPQ